MKDIIILASFLIGYSCTNDYYNYHTTTDGNKMYFESYGSGTTAVVFVHGWSLNTQSWDDQIEFLKNKYRVIVPDLPGFGNSGNNRENWTMQQYGKDIANLCEYLNLKNFYLVGWSMGGPVVLETAKNLENNVQGIVLVDILQTLDINIDSISMVNFWERNSMNYKNYDYWIAYYNNDTVLANRYIKTMPIDDKMPDRWKDIVSSTFQWMNTDVKKTISELDIPIRAINSDAQETNTVEWNEYYHDYDVKIIENSGHFLVWQYPQKFNEILLDIITNMNN